MSFRFPLWHLVVMLVCFFFLFLILVILFFIKYERRELVDWPYWRQQAKLYLLFYIIYFIITTIMVLAFGNNWEELKQNNYEIITALSLYLIVCVAEFLMIRLVLYIISLSYSKPSLDSASTFERIKGGYVELGQNV